MKSYFVALLATSALASPGMAFAQDAAPADDQGGLEEIIVTAQKRAEGLSDVPISMLFPDRVLTRWSSLEHRIAIFVPLHPRRCHAGFDGTSGAVA